MLNLSHLKEHKAKSGIIAGFVTLVVITLLLLAGPAAAFDASLGVFNDATPKKGDIVSSQLDINMNANEMADVSSIDVYIDGVKTCSFDVDGNIMGSCEGLTLEKLSSTAEWGYGYGYGYGYGNTVSSSLSYNLKLNTSEFDIGEKIVYLEVITSNVGSFSSETQSVIISSEGDADYAATIDVKDLDGTKNEDLDASIKLVFEAGGTGSIVVEKYSTQPAGTNSFSIPGLGIYLVVDDSGITSGTISGDTELRAYYTDAELATAGLDESTLRFYFYNATSGAWESPLSSGVNTAANYVWAKTNHFSSWGIFGNSIAVQTFGGSSGTGGIGGICRTTWTCTDWSSCSADGTQTRTCSYPANYCAPTDAKPIESRKCVYTPATTPLNTLAETPKGFFNFITGAFIGTLGPVASTGVIIFAVIIIVALIWVLMKRKKDKKQKKEED